MKDKIKKKIKEASFTLYAVGEVVSEGLRLYFKKRREMLERRSKDETNKKRG